MFTRGSGAPVISGMRSLDGLATFKLLVLLDDAANRFIDAEERVEGGADHRAA